MRLQVYSDRQMYDLLQQGHFFRVYSKLEHNYPSNLREIHQRLVTALMGELLKNYKRSQVYVSGFIRPQEAFRVDCDYHIFDGDFLGILIRFLRENAPEYGLTVMVVDKIGKSSEKAMLQVNLRELGMEQKMKEFFDKRVKMDRVLEYFHDRRGSNSTLKQGARSAAGGLPMNETLLLSQSRELVDFLVQFAWSPDGERIACCNHEPEIVFWDIRENQKRVVAMEGDVSRFSWSADGTMIATSNFNGLITILDVASEEAIYSVQGPPARDVVWRHDGLAVAINTENGILILDVAARTISPLPMANAGKVTSVDWGGQYELAGSLELGMLGIVHPDYEVTLADAQEILTCVRWNPEGQIVASGGREGMIKMWMSSGECRQVLNEDLAGDTSDTIESMSWSRLGTNLATAVLEVDYRKRREKIVKIWDVPTEQVVGKFAGFGDAVWSPAYDMLAMGERGTVHLWTFPE